MTLSIEENARIAGTYGGTISVEEYVQRFPWWKRWLIRRRFKQMAGARRSAT